MNLNPEAEDAVAEFAADCGREMYKTPTACETYLGRYLARYPVELELMVAALRVGVPKRIAAADARVGYDDFLSQMADKFAAAAHTDREAAVWAVGAWAFVLGRPVGYVAPEADRDGGKVYADDGPRPDEGVAKTLMTLIVTAGGFLGGFVGAGFFPVIMMAVDASDAVSGYGYSGQNLESATFVLVLMLMAAAGVVGGLGALGGWWMGQGAEYPWASFGVAFGAALTTTVILLFLVSPLIKPIVLFAAVFGATYKSAARGGNY